MISVADEPGSNLHVLPPSRKASYSAGDFTDRLPRRKVTEIMAGEPAPLGPEGLDAALALLAEYPKAATGRSRRVAGRGRR